MSTLHTKLALFDKSKENIPRLITSTRPVRELYPESGKKQLQEGVSTGKIKNFLNKEQQIKFEQEGIRSVINTKNEAVELASSLAMYHFSIKNALISDLAAGLYTMATTGKGLYDARISRDEEGHPISLYITASRETLWKAMFGPLVNNEGYGLQGTGQLLKDAKKRIKPILTGLEKPPMAFASVYKEKGRGEDPISAIIYGSPLSVKYGLHTAERDSRGIPIMRASNAADAVTLELDLFFYPIKTTEHDDIIKVKDRYIQQIAGLTTFLQFGSRIVDEYLEEKGIDTDGLSKERRPDVLTMRKIILMEQTAFELGRLFPGIIRESSSGRMNIVIRREAIKTLYPSAYNKTINQYNYKLFSNVVAHTGRSYNAAINRTDIAELLNEGIFIPANDKGAEFPRNPDTVVYLKADKR